MKIFAISGSLRSASINTAFLRALKMLAPVDIDLEVYNALGELPIFNPDSEPSPPAVIKDFWLKVESADLLLIASPEYAHGIPGGLKNALDWLVGFEPFTNKRVVVINTAARAHHADNAIREVLKTMNAVLVEQASVTVPLLGANIPLDEMHAVKPVSDAASELWSGVRQTVTLSDH